MKLFPLLKKKNARNFCTANWNKGYPSITLSWKQKLHPKKKKTHKYKTGVLFIFPRWKASPSTPWVLIVVGLVQILCYTDTISFSNLTVALWANLGFLGGRWFCHLDQSIGVAAASSIWHLEINVELIMNSVVVPTHEHRYATSEDVEPGFLLLCH